MIKTGNRECESVGSLKDLKANDLINFGSYKVTNEASSDNSKDKEALFKLRTLVTEASEALYKYEELDDLIESRDILSYLIKDSKSTFDYIKRLVERRKTNK